GLGRHAWDVPFYLFNPNYALVATIGEAFYGISIMFTKLSILAFYLRFATNWKLRAAIYTTMAIAVIYSLLLAFIFVYRCRPIQKHWDLTITYGSCIDWRKINIFSGVMNTATDFTILVLPVLMIRLQLPIRQKIGVIVVLMTGGFVTCITIIRLKSIVNSVSNPDFTWEDVPQIVWWTTEVDIAIVCACLPAGKPFLRRHFP
ncbi:hypothetical protein DM02DRAFT_496663, partial [Periconia macrospinosa]